jgi:hypothetical protein
MNRFLDYAVGGLNFVFFFLGLLGVAAVMLGLSPLVRTGSFGFVMVALVTVPFVSVALYAFAQQPGAGSGDRRYLLALGILNLLPLVIPWSSLGVLAWIPALLSVVALRALGIPSSGEFAHVIVLLPYVLNLSYVVYLACRPRCGESRVDRGKVTAA